MINLFQAALANIDALEQDFKVIVAEASKPNAGTIREFAAWVEQDALLSINTKLHVVLELVNGREYQNNYEWAEEQSALSGRPTKDVLRERLNDFYEKRITFDREFEESEGFRYAALNAGGAGVSKLFSSYCVVLNRAFQMSLEHIACLPGDSLIINFSAEGTFDKELFDAQIAPHSHRHMLVTKYRAREIPGVERNAWPDLVLSENRFFEVIFIGDVYLDSVECVRIPRNEYTSKWDLTFLNLAAKRSDAERAVAHDFLQLRRAELAGTVRLEVV
jgi:hypothetical protein